MAGQTKTIFTPELFNESEIKTDQTIPSVHFGPIGSPGG
jgi:hypothetical protein